MQKLIFCLKSLFLLFVVKWPSVLFMTHVVYNLGISGFNLIFNKHFINANCEHDPIFAMLLLKQFLRYLYFPIYSILTYLLYKPYCSIDLYSFINWILLFIHLPPIVQRSMNHVNLDTVNVHWFRGLWITNKIWLLLKVAWSWSKKPLRSFNSGDLS